jgi:hypothetical protein
MPRPPISEAIIFEGVHPDEERAAQLARQAAGESTEVAKEAESRAVRLNRLLRDTLGYWINDGVVLELTDSSALPYGLRIATQNKYKERAEVAYTEVEVAPVTGEHRTNLRLDTTDPLDHDPAGSLVVIDPATGEEYPVTALEPDEKLRLTSVVGRLETDIERELREEHFRVQPLLH